MIVIIRVPLKIFNWQIRLTIFLICLLKIQRRAFSLFWISLIDDERPPSHLIQICLNPISASEISLNLKSKFRINPVKAESRRTFKNLSIPKAQAPQLPKKFKLLKVAFERKALVVNPGLSPTFAKTISSKLNYEKYPTYAIFKNHNILKKSIHTNVGEIFFKLPIFKIA